MKKPKDEYIELADTINDTPNFIYDNTTPTNKSSRFNEHGNELEENMYLNSINKDKDKSQDNRVFFQRENRRIISLIKKIINKKEPLNTTKISIKNILLSYKNNITLLKDDKKNTLLHIFVELKDVSSFELIIEIYEEFLGVSKNFYDFLFSKNIDDLNIFDMSVEKGYIAIIKLLYTKIEKESNYSEKNIYLKYIKNNLFHIAAKNNQIFPIIFFYEKLNKYFNNKEILDTNEIQKEKMAPIHYACKNRNITLMNLLIDLGANINSQDKNGYTPLHYSVINNDMRMLKHLLIRGGNKFITDGNNLTPFDLAFILGESNLTKILSHKNFCQKQFCGEELGPISKKNNMFILFISLIFIIIIKTSLICRFYFLLNNFNIDFSLISSLTYINYRFNNFKRNLNELYINDLLYCIDDKCQLEKGILFSSLTFDILLLYIVILFKYSKSIFLSKNNESLTLLIENNEIENICVKCRIVINETTKHCLICDRCIEKWDHHCFWLNTCINNKNYCKFKLFIFCAILFLFGNLFYFIMCSYFLFSSKDLFIERFFKVNNRSLWKRILFILLIGINFYLIIIITYSLIFVIIPIIRSMLKNRGSRKIKQNKKNQKEFKNNSNIIDNEDEDIITINLNK